MHAARFALFTLLTSLAAGCAGSSSGDTSTTPAHEEPVEETYTVPDGSPTEGDEDPPVVAE